MTLSLRLPLPRPATLALGGLLALSLTAPVVTPAAAQLSADALGSLRGELTALGGQIQLAQLSGYDAERLDGFERVVRDLTGRVETMEFRLRQLSDRLERLEARQESGAPVAGLEAPRPTATYQPPAEEGVASGPAAGGPRVLGALPQSAPPAVESPATAPPPAAAQPAAPEPPAQQQAALPAGDAAAQYDHAFGLLRQANWPEAEAALRAFLERHSSHSLAGNAKYWLGETHYVRGDYVSAARVFAEGFQQYPNSGKASDNLLKLGMSLAALDRREDACGTFTELERRYSDAPAQILQRSQAERSRLGC